MIPRIIAMMTKGWLSTSAPLDFAKKAPPNPIKTITKNAKVNIKPITAFHAKYERRVKRPLGDKGLS